MTDRSKILVFGLADDEKAKLVRWVPGCDLIHAESWQDMIAICADLTIANFSGMDTDAISTIYGFYKQIEPSPQRLIIVNTNGHHEKIKNVQIEGALFANEVFTKTTVLSALHDTARDVDFSRRMVITLDIMKLICKHPGISTKELAEREELSERSIKRYIDTLRMAGAEIIYKKKGWYSELAVWDY